nr:MAG TPA: tail protein [Caudoviricetes sp.]
MQTSSNYGLKLMEGTDLVQRQDFVDNFSKIDVEMKNIEDASYPIVEATGTNSYIGATARIKSLKKGTKLTLFINTDATGDCNLNLNSYGIKKIKDSNGNVVSNLKANIPYNLCYNGTDFILQGKGGGGNLIPQYLLKGYYGEGDNGRVDGTMVNRGLPTINLNCGGTYNIQEGYYGGGTITANSLTSQTSATAVASDVISGKTVWVDGSKLTGTMSNKAGSTTQWCGYETITVQPNSIDPTQALVTLQPQYGSGLNGYYDSNSKVLGNIANLNASNIKAGIKVGRNSAWGADTTNTITGTFTADATATASQILSGKTAYVNGNKVTGTMPFKGMYGQQCTSQIVWNDRLYYRIPEGYYGEGNYDTNGGKAECYLPFPDVANVLGITANKIVAGNTICGVAGTAGGGNIYTGEIKKTNINSSFTIETYNIPFTPKVLIITGDGYNNKRSFTITYVNKGESYSDLLRMRNMDNISAYKGYNGFGYSFDYNSSSHATSCFYSVCTFGSNSFSTMLRSFDVDANVEWTIRYMIIG